MDLIDSTSARASRDRLVLSPAQGNGFWLSPPVDVALLACILNFLKLYECRSLSRRDRHSRTPASRVLHRQRSPQYPCQSQGDRQLLSLSRSWFILCVARPVQDASSLIDVYNTTGIPYA